MGVYEDLVAAVQATADTLDSGLKVALGTPGSYVEYPERDPAKPWLPTQTEETGQGWGDTGVDTYTELILKSVGDYLTNRGVVPWFEWNATDLSQFNSVEEGSEVDSSDAEVIELFDCKWIKISAYSETPNSVAKGGVWLRVTESPPTTDNLIIGEFICYSNPSTQGGQVYACMSPRYSAPHDGYCVRFSDNDESTPHQICRMTGSYGSESIASLGDEQTDPESLIQYTGMRLALGVDGNAVLVGYLGEVQVIGDGSQLVTVTGSGCAIGVLSNYSRTNVMLFRNLRCYTLPPGGFMGI